MSTDKQKLRISGFIEDNISLFTGLSIFGAISIYLAQFPISYSQGWEQLGMASSLFLFILTALGIRRRLQNEVGGNLLDHITKPNLYSFKFGIFVISFYMLIVSVGVIIIEFSESLMLLLQFSAILVGISTIVGLVLIYEYFSPDSKLKLGEDKGVYRLSMSLFLISCCGLVLAGIGYWLFFYRHGHDLKTFISLNLQVGVEPILFGYLAGLGISSILYFIISSMLSISHFILLRIDLDLVREELERLDGDEINYTRQTTLDEY